MIEEIKEIILETLDINEDEIKLDSNLVEDFGMDSLNLIEISSLIENKYNISIEKEEIKKIVKVKDLINLIENKLN